MRIEILSGDITTRHVDAIVNSAHPSLLGGGGVDGAIHVAAGPQLLAACKELRAGPLPDGLPVGQAVATPGYQLPAHWIIHAVGPNTHAGQTDPAKLADCFRSSLRVAEELGAESLAFPAIGAGIYGWPIETVAEVGLQTVLTHDAGETTLELVEFVLFSERSVGVFRAVLADLKI